MNKRLLFGILGVVAVSLLFLVACTATQKSQEQQEVERAEQLHRNGNRIAIQIIYLRDARTGICFAYYWGGDFHGGPALATVDCERVKHFLVNEK